jgi:hypothetical protein
MYAKVGGEPVKRVDEGLATPKEKSVGTAQVECSGQWGLEGDTVVLQPRYRVFRFPDGEFRQRVISITAGDP